VIGSNSRRITSSSSEELEAPKMVFFALDPSSSSSCTRARRESERAREEREREKERVRDRLISCYFLVTYKRVFFLEKKIGKTDGFLGIYCFERPEKGESRKVSDENAPPPAMCIYI
jgi:hypothetical protein